MEIFFGSHVDLTEFSASTVLRMFTASTVLRMVIVSLKLFGKVTLKAEV